MVHLGSKLTQFTVLSYKSNNHIFQIPHSHKGTPQVRITECCLPKKPHTAGNLYYKSEKKTPEDGNKGKAIQQ